MGADVRKEKKRLDRLTIKAIKDMAAGLHATAGRKAFVVNRIGDFGFLIGTDFTPTGSGFEIRFSEAVDASVLNLYDVEAGLFGPADVTLIGDRSGPLSGSLVLDESNTRARFVATGALLAPDTYTVRLRSADDAFKSLSGTLLRGGANDSQGLAQFLQVAEAI